MVNFLTETELAAFHSRWFSVMNASDKMKRHVRLQIMDEFGPRIVGIRLLEFDNHSTQLYAQLDSDRNSLV